VERALAVEEAVLSHRHGFLKVLAFFERRELIRFLGKKLKSRQLLGGESVRRPIGPVASPVTSHDPNGILGDYPAALLDLAFPDAGLDVPRPELLHGF